MNQEFLSGYLYFKTELLKKCTWLIVFLIFEWKAYTGIIFFKFKAIFKFLADIASDLIWKDESWFERN